MWEQFSIICYQMWMWLKYEVTVHPLLFLGTAIVIVSAWILFKAEVKGR